MFKVKKKKSFILFIFWETEKLKSHNIFFKEENLNTTILCIILPDGGEKISSHSQLDMSKVVTKKILFLKQLQFLKSCFDVSYVWL